jgi:hypothetical protein
VAQRPAAERSSTPTAPPSPTPPRQSQRDVGDGSAIIDWLLKDQR